MPGTGNGGLILINGASIGISAPPVFLVPVLLIHGGLIMVATMEPMISMTMIVVRIIATLALAMLSVVRIVEACRVVPSRHPMGRWWR